MGTFDESSDVTSDPTRIRALAHPIRLSLLEYLGSVDSATATQCAEAIGESVASCSFHLRTLAKHRYIERAESHDSKSRPWQVVSRNRSQTFDPTDRESLPAISALGTAVVHQTSARIEAFLQAAPSLPQNAIERSILATTATWLTEDEHNELIEGFFAQLEKFRGRNADPSLRPEGAVRNTIFLASTPELAHYLPSGTTIPGPNANAEPTEAAEPPKETS